MIKEVIILAGGMGTRLRPMIPDLPKCLAPINGKPFLHYLISELQQQGISHFIFSIGIFHEKVEEYLLHDWPYLNFSLSIENTPLGTGGAILLAIKKCSSKEVLIMNGDTLFKIDIHSLYSFHQERNATCTLALKPMEYFDRYGAVILDENDAITAFHEKKFNSKGLINGGAYILSTNVFSKILLPEKFSFEKDFLEKQVIKFNTKSGIYGMIQNHYFIDIGIPKDLERAQKEFITNSDTTEK